ncbi:polysaccharide biosynthesis/export family protein [Luteolibacter sp. AS25]|uniref:polysaccharide biosynthesis/export family protein n=1 Tax=Luteolibacter sp. AS25 TaxID=3135776 RepID=UPI00398A83D9
MNIKILSIFGLLLLGIISPVLGQIEAGTSVQISIMGVPAEEKGKIDALYPVSQSGTVNLPFIGVIRAAGMRPENLASSIQNAYKSAQIYTSPTIQVVSTAEGGNVVVQMVHVGGQIRRPGPVNFQKNLTIYQAVQAAGGASEFGSLKRVKLYRDGKTLTYDLTNPQFMRVPLRPNDTLEIPQKNWLGQ